MLYTIETIGRVHSPYRQKFGTARQPGLVPAAEICIELCRDFPADSVRGLAGFDYIWLHFIFHDVISEGWAPLVRPPRLGGKQKMGVFATRSPHRPNHLGLSLLKLERIDHKLPVRLWCSGGDIIDGTPVIDIKPYIPFIEAQPQARAGFADHPPPILTVHWTEAICRQNLPMGLAELIEQSIAQDPRPAYQNLPERRYAMTLADHQIHFRISGQEAWILAVETTAPPSQISTPE